ncbi:MAG: superoxide dismutase family protein [Bacillota bacterium]|nr:superoxide dismutase family protein [Bacillota bacterium]
MLPYCPYFAVNQVAVDYLPPEAAAVIRGGPLAPYIQGVVTFKTVPGGVKVCVDISGLPQYQPGKDNVSPIGPFGFHIHENGDCEVGDPNDPFKLTGGHYNPTNQPHGNHAGDFPVLFSNHGIARTCFFTDKFAVRDIIGRSVVIHQNPDDYRTQPAGNSGKKIACGEIRVYR